MVSSNSCCAWAQGCSLSVLLRRLHHREQAGKKRQGFGIGSGFNPGVSPFGESFGPAPSASIVYISMLHSLVTTGADLSAKINSRWTAAKGVPEFTLFIVQPRRRGGIEASKRPHGRAGGPGHPPHFSTARECWCRALAASRRWFATSSRNSARLEIVFSRS